jgi:molybdate transport system substrate-binding protein
MRLPGLVLMLLVFVPWAESVWGLAPIPSFKLRIATASNLAPVTSALTAGFQKRFPGSELEFVLGASGALTTQIQNGAPFDLLLSADEEFPQSLAERGLSLSPPQVYATGKLILLSTQVDLASGLVVLTDPLVRQFALANPETSPYGRAAMQALKASGLWPALKPKAVVAQTITQAVQFTVTATGIGLVNKSALYSSDLSRYLSQEGHRWLPFDPTTYAPLKQALVVLAQGSVGRGSAAARAFVDYLLSEGQLVLAGAGYGPP